MFFSPVFHIWHDKCEWCVDKLFLVMFLSPALLHNGKEFYFSLLLHCPSILTFKFCKYIYCKNIFIHKYKVVRNSFYRIVSSTSSHREPNMYAILVALFVTTKETCRCLPSVKGVIFRKLLLCFFLFSFQACELLQLV